MKPTAFAIAYRRHLERAHVGEREPAEPNPEHYGMPHVRDEDRQIIGEHPAAEAIRLAVYQEFQREQWERNQQWQRERKNQQTK